MIQRLIQLEVEGFRAFNDSQTIPLDANVVLIYGPNGSGKTGLLYALEFAITGAVSDLQNFIVDYPRCLKHIQKPSPARISWQFQTLNGELSKQDIFIADSVSHSNSSTSVFSKEDRQFFLERCYLSQARLGRLLELYQASDSGQQEQMLVRFVRELIGLNHLENLITGLRSIGDKRLLDNVSRPYRRLMDEKSALSEKLSKLNQQKETQTPIIEESIRIIQNQISENGDPADGAPWTASGLQKRREVLEVKRHEELLVDGFQKVQQQLGRLEHAKGFLNASNKIASSHTLEALRTRLVFVEQRQNDIGQKLIPLIRRANEIIVSLNVSHSQMQPTSDISQQLGEIEVTVRKVAALFDAEIKMQNETEAELQKLEQQVLKLETDAKEIGPSPSATVESHRRLIDILRGVLDYIHGNECPVCGRDYSELYTDDLRSRVVRELDKLGVNILRLESTTKRRAEIEVERGEVLGRIAAIKNRTTQSKFRFDQIRMSQQYLMKLNEDLSAANSEREEWEQLRSEKVRILADIEAIEIQLRHDDENIKDVFDLANEIGLSKEDHPTDSKLLIEIISSRLQEQANKLRQDSIARDNLISIIREGEMKLAELERLESDLSNLKALEKRIDEAIDRVEDCRNKALRLRDAATSTKTKLVDQVFNENLNGLLDDIFSRLVKFEKFKPRISEPTLKRNKIRACIEGIVEGYEPFEDAAAILSTGNLNTAALSLFLSLHLIIEPKHRLLVLDDPVQSMDDIHIMQLAGVLRTIVQQANRQLVVAVHERALFDYLCLELGPTRKEDSLIAVELVRNQKNGGTHIKSEKHIWKPDLVRFGT